MYIIFNVESEWCFLFLEYCELGNLYSFQSKLANRVFNLEESINIFQQILSGVKVIHQNNVIHRDLKLENIFIKKNPQNNHLICKIGDFGLARQINIEETAVTDCGTQSYMAPEMLLSMSYGKQVDVWALGVMFYYMLFG